MLKFDEMQVKEYQKSQETKGTRCAFFAHAMYGDRLYYVDNQYNRLFSMNPESGESEFIMYVKERKCESDIYAYMVSYKDELWLIPWMKKEISIVDLSTYTIRELKIPSDVQEIRGEKNAIKPLFGCVYQQGDPEFWLLPDGSNGMLKVDMECHEINKINVELPDIQWKDGCINFYGGVLAGDNIWFCSCDYPKGVVYNTKEDKFSTYNLEFDQKKYSHIYQYKDWICFFPEDMYADILLMNQETKEIKKIKTNSRTPDKRYFKTVIHGDYAMTVPFSGSDFYLLDLKTGEMQTSDKPQTALNENGIAMGRYQTSFLIGDKAYFVSDFTTIPMLVYDMGKNETKFVDIYYNQEQYEKKLEEQLEKGAERVKECVNFEKGTVKEKILPLKFALSLLLESNL